jgi:hypothetical protein
MGYLGKIKALCMQFFMHSKSRIEIAEDYSRWIFQSIENNALLYANYFSCV